MEDLEKISISSNGQWTLEKANNGPSKEEMERMVEAFKQRAEQRKAASAAAAAQRAAGGPRLANTPNMRPAAINDMLTPKPQPRPYKSQDESVRNMKMPGSPKVDEAPAQDIEGLLAALKARGISADSEPSVFDRLNRQAEADNEKGAAKQQHGEAWKQTADFLANHGSAKERARWAKLNNAMTERERLNAAHNGQDLIGEDGRKQNMTRFDPPQERVLVPPAPMDAATAGQLQRELAGVKETDPEKRSEVQAKIRSRYTPQDRYEMRPRKGTRHGEGATTTGRVVPRMFSYPDPKKIDPETGEPVMRHGRRMAQEKHHWAWDEPNQKWNRTHTTYENTDWDKKTAGPTEEEEKAPKDNRVYVLDGEGGGSLVSPEQAPTAPAKATVEPTTPTSAATPGLPTGVTKRPAPQVTVKPQLQNGTVTVRPRPVNK